MISVNEIVEEFVRQEADDDIGLWQVAGAVREDLGLSTDEEVKAAALDVVRGLIDHGLWPGDFNYGKSEVYFWDEPNAAACVARIDREWDVTKGDPNLAESICWFRSRRD